MTPFGLTDAGISWLATGLLHGTALALVTWVACRTVLSRSRPALRSALWTLVLLKFAVPIGPTLSVSLSAVVDGLVSGNAQAATQTATFVPAEALVAGPASAAAAGPGLWSLVGAGLILAYLVLVAVVGGRRLARHIAARRRVLGLPRVGAELAGELASAAKVVGLRRLPVAVVDAGAAGPHLVGVVRPVLVMPAWMAHGSAELRAALVHELAHVRRHDTWLRGLQLAVGTLFFFWPVVAMVSRRLDAEREMACDDWVLARSGVDARSYARLLVSVVTRARGRAPCASVGLLGRRPQLEERVRHLMARRRRHPSLGPAAGVAVAAWAVVALAGSARAAHPVRSTGGECVIDESLVDQIMASYPDADTDGNGELSRSEICAHNEKMKRLMVDQAFEELPPDRRLSMAERVDPSADANGDGVLSHDELEGIVSRVAQSFDPRAYHLDPVAFPGRVCEEAAASCTEGDGRDLRSE